MPRRYSFGQAEWLLVFKFKDFFSACLIGTTNTDEPVEYEALVDARERLITQLKADLTASEKQFLLSLQEGKPDWKLVGDLRAPCMRDRMLSLVPSSFQGAKSV